jgi:hypothetical protein
VPALGQDVYRQTVVVTAAATPVQLGSASRTLTVITRDFNVAYRLPIAANTLLSLDVQNAFNDQKQQFIGAPAIGRLIFLQAQYTFGALGF